MTEKPHHRTFRDDNSHRFGNCAHIGGSDVPTAKSQRDIDLCIEGIKVAARRKNGPLSTHDKPAVQLGQFLDGSAEIEIGNVARRLRMSQ
jgi:hypothetical protein